MATRRLNQVLAQIGVASRRKADDLISEGRVSIDGKPVTELGTKVDPSRQEISVDGVPLDRPSSRPVYYLLHKPRGVVTTLSDPEGRPTVRDIVRVPERVFPVGRLDFDTEGVLLLTNDGDLTNSLTHPRYGVDRTYRVKVKGRPSILTISKLKRGVRLEDGLARPAHLAADGQSQMNSWFKMTVKEGRNRLVKRMWMRVGHPVLKLIRVSFAGLDTGKLSPGQYRRLRPAEIQRLKEMAHFSANPRKHRRT